MNRFQANLCLLLVTFCWSAEVIMAACVPGDVVPFAMTCVTSLIGGGFLWFLFSKRIKKGFNAQSKKLILLCFGLSAMNCVYNALFMTGWKYFDVSTGAFMVCFTAVVIPFVLMARREQVEKKTWISSGLICCGILVAIAGLVVKGQAPGFIIIITGCVLRAVFICLLNKYTKEYDPVLISSLISLFVGIIGFGLWFSVQHNTFAAVKWTGITIASLAIYAYFSITFAQTVNIFAQKRSTAANATIIYSLQVVFSIILGAVMPAVLITPTVVTVKTVIGLVFIVAGTLVEVLWLGKRKDDNTQVSE